MLGRARTVTLTLLAVAALGLGCVGGSKSSSVNKEALKQYILPAAPGDVGTRLDIDFEGKAKLLGYKITPAGSASPGAEVKLTMYWQATENIGDGWNLFTHVLDAGGERILNVDNVGPLREWVDNHQALAPSFWEKGKVYVDEQTFRLPDQIASHEIKIVTGIWKESGYNSIVYYAAIMGIPPALYEALKVDGGNKLQEIRYVTIPCIAPTLIIMVIMRIGRMLSIGYERVLLLYNTNIYVTADVLSTFEQRIGIISGNYGIGSASSLFNSLIAFALVIGANTISRNISKTSLW